MSSAGGAYKRRKGTLLPRFVEGVFPWVENKGISGWRIHQAAKYFRYFLKSFEPLFDPNDFVEVYF